MRLDAPADPMNTLAWLEATAERDALAARYAGNARALADAEDTRRYVTHALTRLAAQHARTAALAGVALLATAGCASTSHYYSANDYRGVRVGSATITSGVNVGVTPAGVRVEPRVRVYVPRQPTRRPE